MRFQQEKAIATFTVKQLLWFYFMRIVYLSITALFLFTACGATKPVNTTTPSSSPRFSYVDFLNTDLLSEAIAVAEKEGKMVFLDFYTSWCLPCKLMDEEVFTDKNLGDYMNANFVSVKIDAENGNGPNLSIMYSVQAYPTLVFIDTKGRVHAKKEGAAFQTELKKLADQALRSGK